MPANLITLAHFPASSVMSLPKSAGEPASGAAEIGEPRLNPGIGDGRADFPC
jgi:hypothetical protein